MLAQTPPAFSGTPLPTQKPAPERSRYHRLTVSATLDDSCLAGARPEGAVCQTSSPPISWTVMPQLSPEMLPDRQRSQESHLPLATRRQKSEPPLRFLRPTSMLPESFSTNGSN